MGGGSSAPVDTFTIQYNDGGAGGAAPGGAKKKGKKNKVGDAAVEQTPVEEIGGAAAGAAAALAGKGKPSAAKAKMLKAKNALAVQRAFSNAGEMRGQREHRKANSKHGWIAKDMTVGPNCTVKKFEVDRIIGMGLMGTVRIAKWKKDNTYCVVKAIKKDYVTRHNDGRHVQNERRILNDLDHPFIVRLFGTFQDPHRIFFVMEYIAGGELFSRLVKKDSFSANVSKFYIAEIFLALEYIHESGYCYRDLKPENIMLDEEGHCKVVDFGFCRSCGADERMKTQVGTPAYLSPEQLDGKFTGGYTRIVDWWSLGIITYELMSGKTPFCKSNSESSYAIYMRVQKGKFSFNKKFDNEVKDLVKKLLTADVSKRLTSPTEIRAHPWFADIQFDRVASRRMVPPHVPSIGEPGDTHYFDEYAEEGEYKPKNEIDDSLFAGF
mmetsp:Transcript_33500/g.77425  ORF Transcript_33500/g.77425 Transcript_33500/m.77425 type:complete len:437 (-) Transcript_33500:346-1656(-)|eukprot:CAMPEP_0182558026 /NCGR_PEP_ID=MMETSP1324-20130603/1742_1 /TAXON_ID=236786 /ORGANISM="Florenciella sp., Strain RCC1587" /LENGTH=436 /DNA_ID=CAMNT_0024770177 /DNA_START=294 /DNA_END=1604 /DNA_ORIENTATION=-